MENNNNGRGIFYGVIGVATLVVAIIGATFAYFSASVTRNSITNITATRLTLDIIQEKMNFKQDLIPVETDGENDDMFARYISLGGDDGHVSRKSLACKDDVGNSICSVYQFTVQNPSGTTAQTVVGSMKVSTNTFKNLYYAVFKGAENEISTDSLKNLNGTVANTVVGGTAGQGGTTGADQVQATAGVMVVPKTRLLSATEHTGESAVEGAGKDGVYDWPATLETLSSTNGATTNIKNTTTYTVVIWLEETGSDQTSDDAGNTFAAGITFTSNTGAGVTGIISAGN